MKEENPLYADNNHKITVQEQLLKEIQEMKKERAKNAEIRNEMFGKFLEIISKK
jgi:hypothetical protein